MKFQSVPQPALPNASNGENPGFILWASLAVALFAVHAALLYDPFLSTVDDAFITFRYSRNWADGWGLVFNRGGVRAEGLNNYLWIAFGVPLEALGLPTPQIAVWTGWAASAASALLVCRLLADDLGRLRWVAAFALGLWSPYLIWSIGGLETGVYGLAVTALVYAHHRKPRCLKGRTAMGLLWLAVPLLRPEGILLSSAFAAVWLLQSIREKRGRSAYAPALILGVGFLAFQAWRFLYFAYPFPNTYYYKMAFTPLLERWSLGADYLMRFFGDSGAWFLVPLWIFAGLRWRWAELGALAIGLLSVVHMGGDWMNHYRFLAPLEPLMILTAFHGAAVPMRRWSGAPKAGWLIPVAATIAWSLPATVDFPSNPSTYLGWHIPAGKRLGERAPEGATIFLHDVGALPYYAPQLTVIDALGLTDPPLAHAGHLDRAEVALARNPEMIVVHPIHAPRHGDRRIDGYRAVPGWAARLELPPALAVSFPDAKGLEMLRFRSDLIDERDNVELPQRRAPRRADAAKEREAKSLYREGMSAWEAGRLEEAIKRFEASRELWPAYAWSLRRLEQARLAIACRDRPELWEALRPSSESYRLPGERSACGE